MIRMFYSILLCISLLGCARTSCDIGTYGSKDRFVSGDISRLLLSSDLDSGYVEVSYQFYSELDSTYKDSVNYMISDYIQMLTEFEGEDYVSPLTIDYIEAQVDSFVYIYESGDDMSDSPVWDMTCNISISDTYSSFAELRISEWSYTGGAHGNGAYAIHIFDKIEGELLELKDFFSDINELNEICESFFRATADLSVNESLNDAGFWFDDDKFTVNNNFSFEGGNVTFHYNSYEIAPYSVGPTDLEIPINKIKHLLKRDV